MGRVDAFVEPCQSTPAVSSDRDDVASAVPLVARSSHEFTSLEFCHQQVEVFRVDRQPPSKLRLAGRALLGEGRQHSEVVSVRALVSE